MTITSPQPIFSNRFLAEGRWQVYNPRKIRLVKRFIKIHYVVVSEAGRRKWIKAGTVAEAKSLKRQIDSLENSTRLHKLGFTAKEKRIDEFFQEYADHIRDRTAPGTVKRYLGVSNTFITFLEMLHPQLKYLSRINRDTIESYQDRRLHSVELKRASDGDKPGAYSHKRLPLPQTVNNEVTMLAIAFNWVHRRDLIPTPPTRMIKKLRPKPKRETRILTEEESRKLLKATIELAKKDARLKVYEGVFKFLLNTGLRSGELCNLYWDDIDLDNGLIQIRAKDGWTPKSSERAFYLNDTSLNLLQLIPTKKPNRNDIMKQITTCISLLALLITLGACSDKTDADNSSDMTTHTYDSVLAEKLGADEYGMRSYVIAFLKAGPNRDQDSVTAVELQKAHRANINRLAKDGKLVLAGPFLDGGEMAGLFIFNVATVEEAKGLTESDPAIQAGRLVMELHPWYGSAGLVQVNEIHARISK